MDENAAKVTINLTHDGNTKQTIMVYDESLGKYQLSQYGAIQKNMMDGQVVTFENVIVMFCKVDGDVQALKQAIINKKLAFYGIGSCIFVVYRRY